MSYVVFLFLSFMPFYGSRRVNIKLPALDLQTFCDAYPQRAILFACLADRRGTVKSCNCYRVLRGEEEGEEIRYFLIQITSGNIIFSEK